MGRVVQSGILNMHDGFRIGSPSHHHYADTTGSTERTEKIQSSPNKMELNEEENGETATAQCTPQKIEIIKICAPAATVATVAAVAVIAIAFCVSKRFSVLSYITI